MKPYYLSILIALTSMQCYAATDIFDAIDNQDVSAIDKAIDHNGTWYAEKKNIGIYFLLPFTYACYNNKLEVVKHILSKQNKCIHEKDTLDKQPLHYAAMQGHVEVAQYLIEQGADINARCYSKKTPLNYADEKNQTGMSKFLIEKGAKVSTAKEIFDAIDSQNISKIDEIIHDNEYWYKETKKVDSIYDLRPFTYACYHNKLEVVKHLLKKQSKCIDEKGFLNKTPLHFVAKQGHVEIARYLIQQRADVHEECSCKKTPLHYAAEEKQAEMVKLLIAKGADISAFDEEQRTPLNYVLEAYANFKRNKPQAESIIKTLLDHGSDINHADKDGITSFFIATCCVSYEILDHFLQKKPNFNSASKDGLHLLHIAALNKDPRVIRRIIQEVSCDINIANNKDKMTPLMFAAGKNNLHAIKVLLENGADPKMKDKDGKIALKMISSKHRPAAQILFRYNGDISKVICDEDCSPEVAKSVYKILKADPEATITSELIENLAKKLDPEQAETVRQELQKHSQFNTPKPTPDKPKTSSKGKKDKQDSNQKPTTTDNQDKKQASNSNKDQTKDTPKTEIKQPQKFWTAPKHAAFGLVTLASIWYDITSFFTKMRDHKDEKKLSETTIPASWNDFTSIAHAYAVDIKENPQEHIALLVPVGCGLLRVLKK